MLSRGEVRPNFMIETVIGSYYDKKETPILNDNDFYKDVSRNLPVP